MRFALNGEGEQMTDDVRPVWVACYRGDRLLHRFEYGRPVNLAGMTLESGDEELKCMAKNDLTNLKLAFPPYHDIRFEINRS